MSRQTNEVILITDVHPKSPISESFRALRTNTRFAVAGKPAQIICITSCRQAEGKTTTAANLAVTFAQEGKRTLLIDADLRKPSQHKVFAVSNRKGLSTILSNLSEFGQSVAAAHVEHLTILPSGPVPPNPAELLGSPGMDALLEQVKGKYDAIIIDTPPVLAVTDAQIVASKSDGVIMVIRAGQIKSSLALKAKSRLEHVQARILGVVLNGKKSSQGDTSYYEYKEHH